MPINKRPQIDEYAINDGKAQKRLTDLMCEQYGFRARIQVPDNGADYLVELIENGATHWHFTVQLKSIADPVFTKDGLSISYNFSVDRLGYLLNHVPQAGLVVLYDVKEDKIYYDFITDIYTRLLNEREGDEWTENDTVSIKVPLSQSLTTAALPEIHAKMLRIFKNSQLMQQAFGKQYGMPAIIVTEPDTHDLNNPEVIKDTLRKYGHQLMGSYDTAMVDDLLCRLTIADIAADKDLIVLKTMIEYRIGRFADSMYYAEKCSRRFELDNEENVIIRYTMICCRFSLGQIDVGNFIAQCQVLLSESSITYYQLVIRININYFILCQLQLLQPMPDAVLRDLQDIEGCINALESPSYKNQLLLWHLENLGLVLMHVRSESLATFEMLNSIGKPPVMPERIKVVQQLIQLLGEFKRLFYQVRKYAVDSKNDLLRSYCDVMDLRFYLEFEISILPAKNHIERPSNEWAIHSARLNNACVAIDQFTSNQHLQDAHNAILNIFDYLYLQEHAYQRLFPEIPRDKLQQIKAQLEAALEIKSSPDESRIQYMIDQIIGTTTAKVPRYLTDEQIGKLADIVLQSGKYPNAQKEYIVQEMLANRLFAQRCQDGTIKLLLQYPDSIAEYYTQPASFKLLQIASNVESMADVDLDRLLRSWGY